jgi:hypothetical protein
MAPVSHGLPPTPANERLPLANSAPIEQPPKDDPSAQPLVSDQLARARSAAQRLARRRNRSPLLLVLSLLVALLAIGGLGIGLATGLFRGRPAASTATDDVATTQPTLPAAAADKATTADPLSNTKSSSPSQFQAPSNPPSQQTTPVTQATNEAPKPSDPEQTKRFAAQVQAIRSALGERRYADAKTQAEELNRLAETDEQRRAATAAAHLVDYVREFWNAAIEALPKAEAAGELKVNGELVSVVEADARHIVIRDKGQNRRYSTAEIPPALAVALATAFFDNRPENKLYLGAFYFSTPPGDMMSAERAWREAAGAGLDVKGLMELLPHRNEG